MMRKLGSAFVIAVLLTAVVGEGTASAVTRHFKREVAVLGNLVGGQKTVNVFAAGVHGNTSCEKVELTGTMAPLEATTLTVHPNFVNCKFKGLPAVATSAGCNFLFHTMRTEAGVTKNAELTIECDAGKEITFENIIAGVVKCIVHIPPQTAEGVAYATEGGGILRKVVITLNLVGLHYTTTAGAGGAGACQATANAVNGTYVGELFVEDEGQGLWEE
jgi:hypothetical protein